MPVFAEELECREKPEHIFFFPFSPFPLGGKLIPSGHSEVSKQKLKAAWSYAARYASN